MTWFDRGIAVGAATLAAWVWSMPAEAGPVAVGLQIGDGTIFTPAANLIDGTTELSFTSAGAFAVAASGRGAILGVPSELLARAMADMLTGGTIRIYVSETGVAPPAAAGAETLASDFSAKLLTQGWTVTEASYLDAADTRYGIATPLSSTAFTAGGIVDRTDRITPPDAPYALTEVFTITAGGAGSADLSIDLGPLAQGQPGPSALGAPDPSPRQVPEPAVPAVLAMGLAGLLAARRRRT
jgi:hypothetical protein